MNNNIRKLRTKKRISRQELAEQMDIDPKLLKQIETGQVEPTDLQLSLIASKLVVLPQDLI